jgi:hypothetical protein
MEDPVRFDLWCECERVNRDQMAAYLRQLPVRPAVAGPDGKRFLGRRMELTFQGRPWRVVQAIRANRAPWLTRLTVYLEGYGPSEKERLHYCGLHDLYYAGVLGCHVCTGFYEGHHEFVVGGT